jgi:hypothetical protein
MCQLGPQNRRELHSPPFITHVCYRAFSLASMLTWISTLLTRHRALLQHSRGNIAYGRVLADIFRRHLPAQTFVNSALIEA